MKFSLSWLADYIPQVKNQQNYAQMQEMITTSIAEVEGFEILKNSSVIIAKIKEVQPHPNADRLKLAIITDGEKEYSVVCGGQNLKTDMFIAYAPIGTKVLWHGTDEMVLEKAKIRGIESEGMICASEEIGLPIACGAQDVTDLTPFAHESMLGKNVFEALDLEDVIFEIDNKAITNRPDLFGHYGIARDVRAALEIQENMNMDLKSYEKENDNEYTQKDTLEKLSISIHSETCRRFCAVSISNIKIEPSPLWLQARLMAVGVRPISNIVDITNYVMYDLGQPMHAYDFDQVKNKEIIVRVSKEGEKIEALNEKTYECTQEDTLICDQDQILNIAGIIGSASSEIRPNTTNILLEAASWDPIKIRKTAQKLGIRTDASTRYEKNIDPNYTRLALLKAIELVFMLCPDAIITSEIFDQSIQAVQNIQIPLRLVRIAKKTSLDIDDEKIEKILNLLGCKVENKDSEVWQVNIPSWRATKDLLSEDDLIEEVARIYGYKNIPLLAPELALDPVDSTHIMFERKIRETFVKRFNFFEVLNYPLTSLQQMESTGAISFATPIELKNSLSADQTHLKLSLLPDLMLNASRNIRELDTFGFFEIGKVYFEEKGEYQEKKKLGGIWIVPQKKNQKPLDHIFVLLKEKLEILFTLLALPERDYIKDAYGFMLDKNQCARIELEGKILGYMGTLSQNWKQKFDLENHEACLFEIDFQTLEEINKIQTFYKAIPKFPPVVRDFSFIIDQSVSAEDLRRMLKSSHPMIEKVDLFDVYQSSELGENMKSLSYQATYIDREKTLEEREIEKISQALVANAKKFGAVLRA